MFRNIMPCKDGYFINQEGGGASWDTIAEFYGREELKEPRFAGTEQRAIHGEEFDRIIIDAVKDRTMAEMFKTACVKHRILFGISQTPEDLANCHQLEARDFYQEVDHPVIGKIKVPFRLFNMTETSPRYRMPAPLLGQHNEEVYTQLLSYAKDDLAKLRELNVI